MNDLLSVLRISHFTQLLSAYKAAGIPLRNAIDGGAGSGSTARQMLKLLAQGSTVYAFEPFSGNHKFFPTDEPNIVLISNALADKNTRMQFFVPAVVTEDSAWGKRGFVGYSSGGRLVQKGGNMEVDCVRGDDAAPDPDDNDFIKLDLQGGELNALRGMPKLLKNIKFMWIEFMGQSDLVQFLYDLKFLIFDTEYLFMGHPTDEAKSLFDISRENVILSNNKTAWFGFKKKAWSHYAQEIEQYKKSLGLVQTDLVCINRLHVDRFLKALAHLQA